MKILLFDDYFAYTLNDLNASPLAQSTFSSLIKYRSLWFAFISFCRLVTKLFVYFKHTCPFSFWQFSLDIYIRVNTCIYICILTRTVYTCTCTVFWIYTLWTENTQARNFFHNFVRCNQILKNIQVLLNMEFATKQSPRGDTYLEIGCTRALLKSATENRLVS